MGLISYLRTITSKKQEAKILVLGLDNAGKTTILKSISDESIANLTPTAGFNVKNLALEGLNLNVIDVGGQEIYREYWSNYFNNTSALIYVIDSNDDKRLQESGTELSKLLADAELADVPVLIFANKQDMVDAMEPDEIVEDLKLDDIENREWTIMACSAVDGKGLSEGLEWIVNTVLNQD